MRCGNAGTSSPSDPLRDSAKLDFVRTVAVLAVLLDHVLETVGTFNGFEPRPFAWYSGRMGVLFFFVLTSLVLLESLERSVRAGRSSTLAFYVRRAFRIYPLSLVCVFLVVALSIPGVAWEAARQPIGLGQMLTNVTLTQNLFYSHAVLSVLWSLPYELQMYLLLPVIFWCVEGVHAVRNVGLLFVAGVGAALVLPELTGRLSVFSYAPCFLAGAVAYVLARTVRMRLPFEALPLALAVAMAAYCGVASLSGQVHPQWLGWLLCLGLGALLPFVGELAPGRLQRACRTVAEYSYGIYLFHMIALWVGFNLLREAPFALQVAVVGALLVALPWLGHRFVETPGIEAGARVAMWVSQRPGSAPRPTASDQTTRSRA